MSEMLLRWAVAGLTVFFIAWIAAFAAYSTRRNRVNAIAVTPRQASLWQRVLLLVAVALDAYLMFRAPFPLLDGWAFALPSPAPVFALALMALGGGFMIATHLHMGASWRIGVPQGEGDIDELVTTGPHGLSRNPIYLGILTMIAGAALAVPGPLTIGAFVVTFVGLQSIIAEEEAYLEERFGDEYAAYKKRVRRWI